MLLYYILRFTNCMSHEPSVAKWGSTAEELDSSTNHNTLRRIRKSAEQRGDDFKVLEALRYVQQQTENNSVCGENRSVVLDIAFDHSRWKREALLAVEVANLMTSLWRVKTPDETSIAENDTLLYALVRSNVLFLPSVFGSVICFEKNQYRDYERFCPYAFRDEQLDGAIHVIDISVGHNYLTSHETIWWREPRKKALHMKPALINEYHSIRMNATTEGPMENVSVPLVGYKDGFWTRPYFDCFGGMIWMITYLAPFFNETDDFL